jgi:hypothetical protein
MECVEVTPLRELLHRREADAERNKMRGQNQRNGLDDHAWEVTPERPFLPGVTQKLSESDEIGTLVFRIAEVGVVFGIDCSHRDSA